MTGPQAVTPFLDQASQAVLEKAIASLGTLRDPDWLGDASARLHVLASLIAQATALLPTPSPRPASRATRGPRSASASTSQPPPPGATSTPEALSSTSAPAGPHNPKSGVETHRHSTAPRPPSGAQTHRQLRSVLAYEAIRWESRHGWTRSGWGRISQKETQLASVLAQMLPAPDTWIGFADRYLDALDQAARNDSARPSRVWQSTGRDRDRRTGDLAEWHCLLLERLIGSGAEDRLDRLARHPALGGPELGFLKAQLAHQRGDVGNAHGLVEAALQQLPGHQDFLDFAIEIGAPLPPRAQQIIKERSP